MSEPPAELVAEFDTVADWTREAVAELGAEYAVPAACRGSGGPAAMSWLLERLALSAGGSLLDAGAGVGGPAAFAVQHAGLRPVLVEPMPGACRAASALFHLPVVTGDAGQLPMRTASFDAAWSLGVLCTLADKAAALSELRRVLRPGGRLGLLVYLQRTPKLPVTPEGNEFPTDVSLRRLLSAAAFSVWAEAELLDLPEAPPEWQRRSSEVDGRIAARHQHDPRWLAASEQSGRMSVLLGEGHVAGRLIVAEAV